MALSSEEQKIEDAALAFARSNKKTIAQRLTDVSRFIPEENPVSVFMAGSPGAGKTEASIELLVSVKEQQGIEILRIDPDELRKELPDYNGGNSWLFQKGVSVLVDKIHDLALKNNQNFILDGTLSNYEIAEKNIARSLKRKRKLQILYVYQYPELAWDFVIKREIVEGRNISPEHFVTQYFAARDVVNNLKIKFGSELKVDLLMKNTDNTHRFYQAGVDKIDNYILEKYTPSDLERIIKL